MTERIAKPKRIAAYKWVLFQGLITFVLTLIGFIGWGTDYALSILVGGFVVVIPNFVFASYAFRFAGAKKAKQVVASMFRGSTLKLLLTAFFTIVAFKNLDLVGSVYFLSFFIVLMTQWLVPVFFKQQKLG